MKTNVSTMMTYTIRMTALHTSKMFILKERMIDIYPVWSIFLPSSCYQDVQHWSAETAAERLVHYSLMMSSISLYTFSTYGIISLNHRNGTEKNGTSIKKTRYQHTGLAVMFSDIRCCFFYHGTVQFMPMMTGTFMSCVNYFLTALLAVTLPLFFFCQWFPLIWKDI